MNKYNCIDCGLIFEALEAPVGDALDRLQCPRCGSKDANKMPTNSPTETPTMTDEQLREAFFAGFEAGVQEGIYEMPTFDPEMFGDAAISAWEEWQTKEGGGKR